MRFSSKFSIETSAVVQTGSFFNWSLVQYTNCILYTSLLRLALGANLANYWGGSRSLWKSLSQFPRTKTLLKHAQFRIKAPQSIIVSPTPFELATWNQLDKNRKLYVSTKKTSIDSTTHKDINNKIWSFHFATLNWSFKK